MSLQVRQVEYKDKMEEEWELFQKSMKEESHVSATSKQQNLYLCGGVVCVCTGLCVFEGGCTPTYF